MQEDIDNRTIALTVKASRLTAKGLSKIFSAAVHKIQKEYSKAQVPHGRQSVKKLMNHSAATNTIPLDGGTKLFDRVARKWNVDYAFHKTGPKKYILLFKAGQADAITAAFSEYAKIVTARSKDKRIPIREQLKDFSEIAKAKPRERERNKEVERDER